MLLNEIRNISDFNPDLHGQRGMEIYEQMRSTDSEIGASITRIITPLLAADWRSNPARTQKRKNALVPSAKDIENAEYIDEVFLRGYGTLSDHQDSFFDFMRETFTNLLAFGNMVYEVLWGWDAKGRLVIWKLAPRLPRSIWKFLVTNNGELTHIVQRVWTPEGLVVRKMNAANCLVFTHHKEGTNWFGRSGMRNIYGNYISKRELLILDAMRHERYGLGVPVATMPENVKDDKLEEQLQDIVSNVRAHEEMGIVKPFGVGFEIMMPSGQGTNIIESIKYHDAAIAKTMMSEFMNLGGSESGSRAVAESKVGFFLLALQSFARYFSSVINRYIVPKLVMAEKGPQDAYPTIDAENIDAMTGAQMAEILKALGESRFIRPDDPTEDQLRSQLHLVARDPESVREEPVAKPTDPNNPEQQPPNNKPKPSTMSRPMKSVHRSVRGLSRDPFPHEAHVDWAGMMSYLDNAPKDTWDNVVFPIRRKQISEIVAATSNATDKQLSKHDIKRPQRGQLANALYRSYEDSYNRGRQSVVTDAMRQRGPKLMSLIKASLDDLGRASSSELARIRRLADLYAEDATDELVVRAAEVALQARLLGLSEAEIEERVRRALEDLSARMQISKIDGQLMTAFTLGRNAIAMQNKNEIQTAYYSAIMDEGTQECLEDGGTCAILDGHEHAVGDPDYTTPNPNCAYPANCRCTTVYIFNEEPIS